MNMDIYFTEDYAQVNALLEGGEAVHLDIDSPYGRVTHTAIKRKVDTLIDGVQYYDLVTPYGYGGPFVHEHTDIDSLIDTYRDEMETYCRSEKIISEFVRFHPLFQNQEAFRQIYDVEYMRETVATDLLGSEDAFQNEFNATARRRVRKLVRDDRFSCLVASGFNDIEDFVDIYRETMDRHHASDFYYFDRAYFEGLKEKFGKQILTTSVYFEGKIIAMGLYFISGTVVHDHLNGTRAEHLQHSPAYLLKYTMMNWAKANGASLIHYGGGVTNDPEDSVLKFKRGFSRNTAFKFHVGRKVWNVPVYDAMCRELGVGETDYFPAYRAPRHTAGRK